MQHPVDSDLMDRKQLYIIGAVGLVLIFMIEPFAIGLMSNSQRSSSQNGGQDSTVSLTGIVTTNVTIVKYQPYLIVSGSSEGVERAKQKLLDSGDATYAVPNGGSLIVSLKDSKLVPSAAAEFEKENATVAASALISTPPVIMVEGDSLSTAVDGTSFNLQLRPIFEEGAKVPATFTVGVENGQIVSFGSFYVLPDAVRGATVEAELLPSPPESYEIEVEWENRTAGKPFAVAAGAAYKEKSYILIPLNASTAQLDALKVYDYATGTQPGVVSVRNNFTDRAKAGFDLTLMKLEHIFPPTTAAFANQTGNESYVSLLGKLQEGGVSAKLTVKRTIAAQLPGSFEYNGRKYTAKDIKVEIGQTAAIPENATSVNLTIDFEVLGGRVSRITNVKQAG